MDSMDTATLGAEIERQFPPVPKPLGSELSFHKDGCHKCELVRKDLELYCGAHLPDEAIREICQELSCLSAAGWRWMLPSYLMHCLSVISTYDDMETEFLIYSLSPESKYQNETAQRLSRLSKGQLNCLLHFLQWCAVHEHWSDYCPEEIRNGLAFLRTLVPRAPEAEEWTAASGTTG